MGPDRGDGVGDLIDKLRAGGDGARSELLRRLRSLLETAIRANLSGRLRVWVGLEEALQLAWIRVDRDLERLEYRGPEALQGWLNKVARTTLSSLARQEQAARRDRRRERPLPERPSVLARSADPGESRITTPSAAFARRESQEKSRRIVEAALARLGEPDATIVRMWHLREPRATWEEIGAAIGKKADAARKEHEKVWERFLEEVVRERLRGRK